MVRAHQAVFDTDLPRDEVDEAAVDEVRADAPRPLFGEQQAFALDPRQPADPRADRAAGTQPVLFAHLGPPGVLDRLARGVDAIDDAGIALALPLMHAPLVRG